MTFASVTTFSDTEDNFEKSFVGDTFKLEARDVDVTILEESSLLLLYGSEIPSNFNDGEPRIEYLFKLLGDDVADSVTDSLFELNCAESRDEEGIALLNLELPNDCFVTSEEFISLAESNNVFALDKTCETEAIVSAKLSVLGPEGVNDVLDAGKTDEAWLIDPWALDCARPAFAKDLELPKKSEFKLGVLASAKLLTALEFKEPEFRVERLGDEPIVLEGFCLRFWKLCNNFSLIDFADDPVEPILLIDDPRLPDDNLKLFAVVELDDEDDNLFAELMKFVGFEKMFDLDASSIGTALINWNI